METRRLVSSEGLSELHLHTFTEHFRNLNPHINPIDSTEEFISVTVDNDAAVNNDITVEETINMAKNLKNNKACEEDQIINEFLSCAVDKIAVPLSSLFNIVLNSGSVPDDWTLGIIKPIYKQKDDIKDPKNYRGISLISCICKLFTAILNKRLSEFVDVNNAIGEEQVGFRRSYSTLDHVVSLQSIIHLYLNKRKRIYCTFVDYAKAFDSINRVSLCKKITLVNINGRIFKVIYDLYSNAKSCVRLNGIDSEYFTCNVGIRQGDNLSPLLFCIYLNDLQTFLQRESVLVCLF